MMQQEQVNVVVEPAGFGERFVAYLIDGIILVVPQMILRLALGQLMGIVLGIIIGVAYAVYFWTTSGATPGKMLMKLRVVRFGTTELELVDSGTAVVRYLGYIPSSLVLGLGFFWVLWDPNKQAWHDKIAGTQVVKLIQR